MEWGQIAALAAALGLGGAAGAVIGLVSAGKRVADAFSAFETEFEAFLGAQPSGAAEPSREAFDALKDAIEGIGSAFARLKRALRMR